jgi:glyoxylase-like metal-dependent hydrolase (beta-lactamase superfamily II)
VEGNRNINEYIDIIPAPGETIGHQIVRIHSEGETLYCLGDLYHHPVEVEHPNWTTVWSEDVSGGLASREALTEAALAEEAILIATHIGGVGRLKPVDSGVTWDDLL